MKGLDRREERTMASKETAAAGFASVSREITGELKRDLPPPEGHLRRRGEGGRLDLP